MTTTSRLSSAHRGYEYQDLLVACRFVDILLGNVREAFCDEKFVLDDRFDDLTTVDINGTRERVQFKHTADEDRPLSLSTFTNDQRKLRLDCLFASMLRDRDGPGRNASTAVFRVVLRDQPPTDSRLTAVLNSRSGLEEPGAFLVGMRTQRLSFHATALWEQRQSTAGKQSPFAFLFGNGKALSYDDLQWVCERLVIEVGAPRASLDLSAAADAERLLLARARADVGAETFPNVDRTAVDVASALVSAARAARRGERPNAQNLLRQAHLRSDFGAVARAHPVDHAVEIQRNLIVEQLVDATSKRADAGERFLIVGPPGHGKSWVCQQFIDVLKEDGWLVAEHYCYLGDADGERIERVLTESVLGSLLGRLAAEDSRLVQDQRPRFAADEDALTEALLRSRQLEPDRRIALVVDGIDHITRVRARMGSGSDPSKNMAETLAALDLPPGVALIVLSQPGSHLAALQDTGAITVEIPALMRPEIQLLAGRLGVVPSGNHVSGMATPLLEEDEDISSFIDALIERSGGNALYATYLCRETLRSVETRTDLTAIVLELPSFDGTLKNYYEYLYKSLGDAGWVADILALADFAVTQAELREIAPETTPTHRIDGALKLLAPVLIDRATQGGVRIYHESFARYLRTPFQDDAGALTALLGRITGWLETKGLFCDERAFHSLLTLLSYAGNDEYVVDLVDSQFVTNAVAAGFATSAINVNLATAVGAAARLGAWPKIVGYVELARAADAYQMERFDVLVSFADIPATLLGSDTLAERLVDEDRTVMPARAGLQMCAAVDSLGATPPWLTYMDAYIREAEDDNTLYGEISDQAVSLAWLRGRLRLAAASTESAVSAHRPQKSSDLSSPIDWSVLAERIGNSGVPLCDVVKAVLDTHSWEGIIALVDAFPDPADICIVVAETLAAHPEQAGDMESPKEWAAKAARHGVSAGSTHRLLALGIDPSDLVLGDTASERDRLIKLTRQMQTAVNQSNINVVAPWMDACSIAARRDPLGLSTSEAVITGEGWYPCWLRFTLALSRAEAAAPADQGRLALEALQLLTGDLRPFVGDPRACDLYSLYPIIAETITRAMTMLDDVQWQSGLLVLKDISDSITTTMSGELGGPVPPDLVLHLAVDGATPTRRNSAETLVMNEIGRGSGQRFYADIAEYRLLAARLALAADDRQRAKELWREACVFLTAYGWRKDITIYELLDPFPALIEADTAAARRRMAELQSLCERVPLHTDGRETRHAPGRWWSLLAKADPVAAVHLTVPELFAECNDPNWLFNEALKDVWREWYDRVDPVIAGALRLTLDTPLDPADVKQLKQLADSSSDPAARQLLIWLLARADERPVAYSVTNSAEILARDDEKVAGINAIAMAANLPTVVTLRGTHTQNRTDNNRRDGHSASEPAEIVPEFLSGLPGLVKAIRAWNRRPYDAHTDVWQTERFANIIGYRLMDLLAEGRSDDATTALMSLASGSGREERTEILCSIAEGLERYGETQLAARAYALTWTCSRGRGGWLTFGGETAIDSLLKATKLDPETAAAVVAGEIEHIVAASHTGTYGISQAVIYALATGALQSPDSPDVAFHAWDEAFRIIASRAPRVDDSDDPAVTYNPPNQDGGEATPGDLDGALALAALGGLAHASREKKRRSFLAVRLLLEERATAIAPVIAIALTNTSDPATLTWLLSLLDSLGTTTNPVIEACQVPLRKLAKSELLTIRMLARHMITSASLTLAPTTPTAHTSHRLLILGEEDSQETGPPGLDELLDSVAGQRCHRGERIFPELRSTLRSTAASKLSSDTLKRRLERQLDAFSDRMNQRWPDAFLAPNEAIEEALQSVAGAGRATLLVSGYPVADPMNWEDVLTSAILDNPAVPLTLEAHRQPRPPLPPPPITTDELWTQVRAQASKRCDNGIEEALDKDGLCCATLSLEPASSLLMVERGPYRGWYWLATVEKRVFKNPDWQDKRDLITSRYRVVEVRTSGDRQALTSPPVAEGDLGLWRVEIDPTAVGSLDSSQPLVGIDHDVDIVGDGREGLGAPNLLSVPLPSLVALLGLHPGPPCSYEDDDGTGLALVTWRAEYDISDYYLAWPRTYGSGIVIRPDLLDKLVAAVGEERVVVRDFIIGNTGSEEPDEVS